MRFVSRSLRTSICAVGLAAAPAASLRAQTALGPERRDLNNLRGDVWSAWTAPLRPDRRGAASVALGVGGAYLVAHYDSALYVWMKTHPNTLAMRVIGRFREERMPPLDSPGNGQFLLPLSTVLYTAGRLSSNTALRDAGLGCAAAHLSSAGLRELIYLSVARMRPRDTASAMQLSIPGRREWSAHSFLSGHTANSMACASFATHRFASPFAPVLYAYPLAIGLGRMADGRHWGSDTMAGATLGFFIGRYVAHRQHDRAAAAPPEIAAAASRRLFTWQFTF